MVREPKIVMIHASGEIERLSTKDAEAAVSYREVSPMAVSRIDDETTIAELPDARSALRLSPPIVLR
jgi:type II secretory pathway component PulC